MLKISTHRCKMSIFLKKEVRDPDLNYWSFNQNYPSSNTYNPRSSSSKLLLENNLDVMFPLMRNFEQFIVRALTINGIYWMWQLFLFWRTAKSLERSDLQPAWLRLAG